ncbi:hypothetical protein [Comamonas piscis]
MHGKGLRVTCVIGSDIGVFALVKGHLVALAGQLFQLGAGICRVAGGGFWLGLGNFCQFPTLLRVFKLLLHAAEN